MSNVTIEQAASALKVTTSAVKYRAKREAWPYETESCRGGQRRLYPIAALPPKVQAAINVHLAVQKAKEHAGSAVCQSAGRSGLGEVASVSVSASGGEPIQAGLPSPVSCPAATVAGGLTGTGGSVVALSPSAAGGLPALSAPSAVSDAAGAAFFAAGVKAGMVLMSTEDRKAMDKRVKVAERRLNIVKPIIDWEEGKPGKSAFVIAQAKSHGETRATLYRWVKQFQHGGFDALMDKPRADKNAARVLVSAPWEIQARGCGIGKAKMAEIAEEITLVIRGLWAQQGMSSARQVALLAYPVLHKLSVDAGMPDFVAKKACKTISKRLIEGECAIPRWRPLTGTARRSTTAIFRQSTGGAAI